MRQETATDKETTLPRDAVDDFTSHPEIKPQSLDVIMLRARHMRAEATAKLLARLGAAMVRPFRRWTELRHADSNAVIKGGRQGAV